jgi:sulfatase maturation enzyme AslB (radical SAM superfamily)|tara:strand:+ start:684 stop:1955 length:1272 start_codon:yes stop_codon:yes gene_type:complete
MDKGLLEMNKNNQIEYYSRKLPGTDIFSLCKAPFAGLEISPEGYIVLCCAAPRNVLAHIDDIDDLEEFYNGPVMEKYRQSLEDGNYSYMEPCSLCYKKEMEHKRGLKKVLETGILGDFTNFDDDWRARKENKKRPLRFLEYTLSNLCNATCATCNSLFSHKWQSIDKKFGRKLFPIVKLKNDSISKIEKILYGLETLVIKGGEPFADIRNIRILKKLYEINPSCRVFIISNMYTITPEAMEILKMAKPGTLKVSASIDGVGKVYDWIRSNNFEHLIKTMEKYYKETGNKISINVCISLYNFFHLDKILNYFKDKEYINWINFGNITTRPSWVDINCLPEKTFNLQMEKWNKKLSQIRVRKENSNEGEKSQFLLKGSADPLLNQVWRPRAGKELFFSEMEKMNNHRGFDLCDHIPELKIWRDSP